MTLVVTKTIRQAVSIKSLSLMLQQAKKKIPMPRGRLLNEELSLVFVGETTMRRLNKTYRKESNATDVLSFDYGEIIICYPRAVRQARRHGISVKSEIKALFLHALLHVFGYDHKIDKDRQLMQRRERMLLGKKGLITLQGYAL